jgi:hypothetical protein
MTLEELTAQRDALLAARYRGLRTVEIDGRRVTYATDNEMAAAITDLERCLHFRNCSNSEPKFGAIARNATCSEVPSGLSS